MSEAITKELLVYIQCCESTPQRMRLWIREDRNLDGLLWQIERQLVETEPASQMSRPLLRHNCSVFVLEGLDGCLSPYENMSYESLKTCTKLLILTSPIDLARPSGCSSEAEVEARGLHCDPLVGADPLAVSQMTTEWMLELLAELFTATKVTESDWDSRLQEHLRRKNTTVAALDATIVHLFKKKALSLSVELTLSHPRAVSELC